MDDRPPSYDASLDNSLQWNFLDRGSIEVDGKVDFDFRRLSRVISGLSEHHLEHSDPQSSRPKDNSTENDSSTYPQLNIVMHVVGSRGDVQPFVALALKLKEFGHRIRLATHAVFKGFVERYGIEFFSISGDPAELMAYMVKNPGIIPKMESMRGDVIEKQTKAISKILDGCWRSCFRLCDCSDNRKSIPCGARSCVMKVPFIADVIIANPPSFAHIHCAEKLGIPLHIMFTMPWSPTRHFPHPLVNLRGAEAEPELSNYLSYKFLDWITWQGLGREINNFRSRHLGLERLDTMSAISMIRRAEVPHTYCWSEKLLQRPEDWPSNISVAGFYVLPRVSDFKPSEALITFLSSGPSPIYIGFGSIVIDDPETFTHTILEAVRISGVRAVISKGWGGIGAQRLHHSPNIFMLDDCPHDWLFPKVQCVVHHGGAGTTSAGLAAGKPTIIVPFFGDQLTWGQAVFKAGAGPRPLPWKSLTPTLLAEAISFALDPRTVAVAENIAAELSREDGIAKGAESLLANVPKSSLRCALLSDKKAVWEIAYSDLRLSAAAAELLRLDGCLDFRYLKPLRTKEYRLRTYPWDPVSGGSKAIINLFYDTFKGFAEIGSDFTRKPYFGQESVVNIGQSSQADMETVVDECGAIKTESPARQVFGVRTAKGFGRIFQAAARAPMKFTVAMAEGAHNAPRLWGDRSVRKPVKVTGIMSGISAGCQELLLGTYDGITGLVTLPVRGAKEQGMIGFAKGIGQGIVGMPVKFWAGMSGVTGYPLQGVDEQIKKAFLHDDMRDIRSSLEQLGRSEHANLSDDEKAYIRNAWATRQPQK
ncbi:UDP-Glycosyltransferase/glycogen phosphorylase, partial [Aureobasidium melanogenum]